MTPAPVVKDLDIFEQAFLGFLLSVIVLVINQFRFQGTKEAFSHRVIQALTFTAHAAEQRVALEQALIVS